MIYDYEIIEENHGYALVAQTASHGSVTSGRTGKYTVVGIDRRRNQVYDAMPGDRHPAGGSFYAPINYSGICYVASWYSRSWARQCYNRAVKERES
jgi:hypothetical protein